MSKFIKLALLMFLLFPFTAQTEDLSHVALFSSQSAWAEFAPGTSGEVTFTLDESNKISISITTDTPTLVSRVKTPSGQTFDPTTIENAGGVFVNGEKSMLYVLPFAGVGEYAIEFDAPANITENARVIVQVLTDSPLVTNLLVVPNELSQGQTAVLTVPVFDDETPVSGASVKVTLVSDDPLSVPLELTLEDDGGLGDYQAGDGLYSTTLTPTTPGIYRAIADISGHRTNGTAFFRQAGAVVTVFEPLGLFDKTLSDIGIDSNNDGLLDNITISVGINVQKAGEYRVFMNLKTATGQILQASTGAVLETGNHTIGVAFEAR